MSGRSSWSNMAAASTPGPEGLLRQNLKLKRKSKWEESEGTLEAPYSNPEPSLPVLPVAASSVAPPSIPEDLEVALTKLTSSVDAASAEADVRTRLETLDAIWRELERVVTRVEARFRLHLPVGPRTLPALPDWLANARGELLTLADHRPTTQAVDTACRLVLNVQNALGEDAPKPTLSAANLGRVRVEWPSRLVWLVSPVELPWPGVSVRAYRAVGAERVEGITRHLADLVVLEAVEVLGQ